MTALVTPWHLTLVVRARLAYLAALAVLAYPIVSTGAPPDTTEWKCEYCPFETGTLGDYAVGASVVSDDAARYGNGTGYDEEGVYPSVDGEGRRISENLRIDWSLTDIGVDSRAARIEIARPGSFDVSASYRGSPYRLFDTTTTVFSSATADSLSLPAGWTRSGLTSGFADLAASLNPVDIGSDRDIIEIGARIRPGSRFRLHADYRRQVHEGTGIFAGSFFTNASLLPRPFDFSTDEIDLGLAYDGYRGQVELSVYGSYFQNKGTALVWDNPFDGFPGAERGALAQPPDNSFHQVALKGGYSFPASTRLSVSAAVGRSEQDDALLNYTINPNLVSAPLPRTRLDGEIDTTNISIALTSKPMSRLRVALKYRYDERDNQTPRETWSRVIVDSLASGDAEVNAPYSYERARFFASATADLSAPLQVGAGFERTETDRDFQEVAEQSENTGWGKVRWTPAANIDLSARAGTAKREIDRFADGVADALGQNPLLRKYNLAHRYRTFGDVTISGSLPDKPISLSASVSLANDDYSKSRLGLLSSDEVRYSADLSWTMPGNKRMYLSTDLQSIDAEQAGSAGFSSPDWFANLEDRFLSFGLGLHMKEFRKGIDVQFDYARGQGRSEIDMRTPGAGGGPFPDLKSDLDSLRVTLSYRRSDRMEWSGDLRYERFETEDWALQGVGPGTVPTILTLGATPYDYDIFQFGLRFRYRFGTESAAPADD